VSLPTPSEFQSVDGFYEPADGGVLFTLPPVLIGAGLLLLLAALLLGWLIGRRSRPETDPSQSIYDVIKKAVSAAAGAPRDSVAITARHLKTVLEDRLGAVVRLGHGVHGPFGALDDALEGYGEAEEDDHKPGHDEGHKPAPVPLGGARKVTINARTVVLNAHHGGAAVAEADPDEDHGHGHDHDDAHADKPGHDKPHGGHAHAPRKRLDGKAQTAAIRAAVHDFSDYWSDKPARLKDLREARRQLTTGHASASGDRVWDRSK
jgi:hypothetical protein